MQNKMEKYHLKGKIIIKGKIVVKTGLAIGGSTTSLDIGGMDSPVIKDGKGVPYIPGSSIKGKLRSLLEQSYYPLRAKDQKDGKGYFHPSQSIHMFDNNTVDSIMRIFGAPDTKEPVRCIFRDAYLDYDHFEKNREELFKSLELTFTEDKIENVIDRISARAMPRHLERVPMGAYFDFEIIFDLFSEEDKELLKTLFQGLRLLEDDYLGGSGSRGSGKVSFVGMSMLFRSIDYYKNEQKETSLVDKEFNLKDIESEDWFANVIGKINI
ncbi:hypothetical protein ES705_14010 [subsurface metagenome]